MAARYVIEWAIAAPGSEDRFPVGVYAQDEQGIVPMAVPLPAAAIAARTGLHPLVVRSWASYAADVATTPRQELQPDTGSAIEVQPMDAAFLDLLARPSMESGFMMTAPAEAAGTAADVASRVARALAEEYRESLGEGP